MDILFNRAFVQHNLGSIVEGDYRVSDFVGAFEDTIRDGTKYVSLIHTEAYIRFVKEMADKGTILAEVTILPPSYVAAMMAVGLAIQASEQNAFAVIRPPGHHAKRDRADGFCLFNNIAIATQKQVNKGKKVFIFDFDGHHGDGTQSIFYESNEVFYCSVHQSPAYPGTGSADETGRGAGKGYTLNIPLPPGSGDNELLEALNHALEKAAWFKPDVIAVSAGFDGYEEDLLLNLNYTLKGYYEVGYRLSRTYRNIFAVLEGGYHYDIKACVEQFVQGIND